jgi:two-component system, OmpR family, sensor histidine kinase VicK
LTALRSSSSSSSSDTSKTSAKKTEVLYGTEKTIEVIVQSFDRATVGCDVWGNWAVASFILGNDSLRNALVGAKKRGLRLRYITEVTNSNISYCKELAKLVELRHFDGLKGNFGIIDGKEYLATANNLHEVKSLPHLVYSNVSEIIMQQQHVFDTLWYKAMPSELKIKQIENETLDLVDLIRMMYLCRDCMTPFFSKEHVNEHKKNSTHTRILEIPF